MEMANGCRIEVTDAFKHLRGPAIGVRWTWTIGERRSPDV